MKRLTIILLLLSLLFTGCTSNVNNEEGAAADTLVGSEKQELSGDTPQKIEGDTDNTQQGNSDNTQQGNTDNTQQGNTDNTTSSTPPEGAYQLHYDGPSDRTYRAVIYENTAYYECDPYERIPWQPHIYSIPLGEETTATDLLKGELIALAGSMLIGKTDTHFCAMDLSAAKPKWVKLQPAAEYVTHLQDGDTLYLYGNKDGEPFADVIDLKKLKSKRVESISNLRRVVKVSDQLLYLTSDGFYQGDPLKKNAVLLGSAVDGDQLHIFNDRILIYQDGTLPRVYDCKTERFFVPELVKNKVGAVAGPFPDTGEIMYGGGNNPRYLHLLNGIAAIRYKPDSSNLQTLYYDISTDQEITDIDALPFDYLSSMGVDGGYISGYNNYFKEYHVNDKAYTVEHMGLYSSSQKHYELIAETGALHLYGGAIVTVSFEKEKSVEIYHTDQPVTKE